MRRKATAAAAAALVLLVATWVVAEEVKDDGQPDLDRAIEAKLTVRNVRDLNSVISLCESALDKGLSEKNQEFAKQLLASSLLERGSALCEMIFGRGTPPAQWPQMRQIGLADLERALQYDSTLAEAHLLVARLQALPGGDRKRALAALDELVRLSADDAERKSEALVLRSGLQES